MPISPLRAELGEQDHVADGGGVGEDHREAVYAAAVAAGRGHAILQGAQEVLVHRVRLGVAAGAQGRLGRKTLALIQRIVDLGEGVAEFRAGHVDLKAARQGRIAGDLLGERRGLGGEVGDECRLNQLGLRVALVQLLDDAADRRLVLGRQAQAAQDGVGRVQRLQLFGGDARVLPDALQDGQARERGDEADLAGPGR